MCQLKLTKHNYVNSPFMLHFRNRTGLKVETKAHWGSIECQCVKSRTSERNATFHSVLSIYQMLPYLTDASVQNRSKF